MKDWEKQITDLTKTVQGIADKMNDILDKEEKLPPEMRSNWGGNQQQQQQKPDLQPVILSEGEILATQIEQVTAEQVRAKGEDYRPVAEVLHNYKTPSETESNELARLVSQAQKEYKENRRDEAISRFLKENQI